MNHQKVYDKIIENARTHHRNRKTGICYENHHIIPRCLDGEDIEENFVF